MTTPHLEKSAVPLSLSPLSPARSLFWCSPVLLVHHKALEANPDSRLELNSDKLSIPANMWCQFLQDLNFQFCSLFSRMFIASHRNRIFWVLVKILWYCVVPPIHFEEDNTRDLQGGPTSGWGRCHKPRRVISTPYDITECLFWVLCVSTHILKSGWSQRCPPPHLRDIHSPAQYTYYPV